MENNLKPLFEEQVEIIKDKYGYYQKHFTPLVTQITNEKIKMLFCGMELTLLSDNTYFLTDTTGG